MAFKQRTYTEVPHDEAISPQIREFLASLLSQVNALSGRGVPPSGQGIQALSVNTIDLKRSNHKLSATVKPNISARNTHAAGQTRVPAGKNRVIVKTTAMPVI